MQMNYKEKKRSMFFGLPWTFTSYTVTEEIITVDTGLFKKEENDCYLYKVIDVRLESTLLERMLGLGTIHCFTGDVTAPLIICIPVIKTAKPSMILPIFLCTERFPNMRKIIPTTATTADIVAVEKMLAIPPEP